MRLFPALVIMQKNIAEIKIPRRVCGEVLWLRLKSLCIIEFKQPDDISFPPFVILPFYPVSFVLFADFETSSSGLYNVGKRDAWKRQMYSPIQ